MNRIAVIGAGSWGTTVAALSALGTSTVLWARRPALADTINSTRENTEYMPGFRLPEGLMAVSSLPDAVSEADLVVMAVPSHGFRAVFREVANGIAPATPVLSLAKGIEQETLARMTEVVAQEARGHNPEVTGVLTGPNLATEVAAGHPAAAVVAMTDVETARDVQTVFMGPSFRVYTNEDVVGCELAGALKNVMALAAGMSDGLGFGDNSRATLITRALAELTRLGVEQGGKPATFAGLAGMGDLIATCSSTKSRNHQVGVALAQGRTLDEIVTEMNMVAEGIKTTRSVLDLAGREGVEMPIAHQVGQVLYEGVHPKDAMMSLMTRVAKAED